MPPGLPNEVFFILLIVVAIVQVLRAVLRKQTRTGVPENKQQRTYDRLNELRKFLESVSGEAIEEEPTPKTLQLPQHPQPPPRLRKPAVQLTLEEMPRHSIAAPLSQVTEPVFAPQPIERLAILPRVRQVAPREVAPAAPAVSHPPSMDRLLAILANRSLMQQGIVLSEVLGQGKAFRD